MGYCGFLNVNFKSIFLGFNVCPNYRRIFSIIDAGDKWILIWVRVFLGNLRSVFSRAGALYLSRVNGFGHSRIHGDVT